MANTCETDVAIIGAGPCGMFAVFTLGMLGISSVLIDALDKLGGQCNALYPEKPIYDIPGYPVITGGELVENLYNQINPFSPKIFLENTVNSIMCDGDFYRLHTSTGTEIKAKSVIIATGSGLMRHRKLHLDNLAAFEEKTLFYSVHDKELFRDKSIVIIGGGDSAVDWAIELAGISNKVYLVHRRDAFRAMPGNLNKLRNTSNVELLTPYNIAAVNGHEGDIREIRINNTLNGEIVTLNADFLLSFLGFEYGVHTFFNLENDVNFDMQDERYSVDYATMLTNVNRIMAIGDAAVYRGKLKLILTGFAEAALAAHTAYGILNPNKPLRTQYSTSKGIPKCTPKT